MNNKIKNFLIKKTKNKFTGINNSISWKLRFEVKKKFGIEVTHVTINNWIKKNLNRYINANKTFLLIKKGQGKKNKIRENDKGKKNQANKSFLLTKKDLYWICYYTGGQTKLD